MTTTTPLETFDGGRLPACPVCHRSAWQIIREKLGGGGERSVEVRCTGCGAEQTMVRGEADRDWRLFSHRA